jgi:fatty acid desaturase
MPRGDLIALAIYLFNIFPKYWIDYWKQFSGKSGQFALSSVVQLTFVVALSVVYPGFGLLWLTYWWIPFAVYLPFLRFFAESEKHHYEGAENEFDATHSNLGLFQKWFLHPHGDAYHLLHHTAPQVPHWRIAGLHRVLSIINKRFGEGAVRTGVRELA